MPVHWKKNNTLKKGVVIPAIFFVCLLTFFYIGIANVVTTSNTEKQKILQDSVQRAMVQCYAIEGMYPPNISYLEENYGVIIDHEKYVVHYEVFAANILPDIRVIDLSVQ